MRGNGPLLINHRQIRALLPVADCIEVLAVAMQAASAGGVHVEPRLKERFADGAGAMLLMRAESIALGLYALKQISLLPGNAARQQPVIQGLITLFELASGTPVAVLDGAEVTVLRTAAASALATRSLARADAKSLGIFGCGAQLLDHVVAINAVRPLQEVIVWGRDAGKAQQVAQAVAHKTGLTVRATELPTDAAACDIVCTLTAAEQPILQGSWVQPGCHVNLVGAHSLQTREGDTALVQRAAVYVDSLASMRSEAGDIMLPIAEGAIELSHVRGEIGAVLAGSLPGRCDAVQITLYKSLGIAAQDLYTAHAILQRYRATG